MTVKKKYNVGDTVWIYGIDRGRNKSTQGTVIKSFVIDYQGVSNEMHYVIGIPTDIEMLLEIRTWHSISQSKDGQVGSIREALPNPDSARKWLSKIGVTIESTDEEYTGDGHDGMGTILDDDPSTEEIHAALEKSQKDGEHGPLVTNRKRQYFKKKKV
jgi:hypothetical protein